jgi:hypothetical protein
MSQVLPPELMQAQLSQVDLLLAMYPDDAGVDDSSADIAAELRRWETGGYEESEFPKNIPPALSISLGLDLADGDDNQPQQRRIPLQLSVPLHWNASDSEPPTDEAPAIRVRIKQPDWMSKAEVSRLQAGLPDEDMFSVMDHIKEECLRQIEASRSLEKPEAHTSSAGPVVRVWFYFPSISTRAKRDDLVNHGPSYGLTGFLLAGKPGILCVEGTSTNIDDYMKFIKTDSWGDIPAHHKKVSERYRETQDVNRVFTNMQEITDLVGERRGERANRNDMQAVEAWLDERGLGEAFKEVLL